MKKSIFILLISLITYSASAQKKEVIEPAQYSITLKSVENSTLEKASTEIKKLQGVNKCEIKGSELIITADKPIDNDKLKIAISGVGVNKGDINIKELTYNSSRTKKKKLKE